MTESESPSILENFLIDCSDNADEGDIQNQYLNYRVKVFFLGDYGSGKTSIVQSLIGAKVKVIEQSTDGVNVDVWYPFKNSSHANLLNFSLTHEQRHLILEMWDLAGRKVCEAIHPVYLTPDALYVVIFNSVDDTSVDSVVPIISSIQLKVPGSTIIIVAAQTDKGTAADNSRMSSRALNLLASLKLFDQEMVTTLREHASKVRGVGSDSIIQWWVSRLECVVNKRPNLPSRILKVSCCTGKGLDELRKEILLNALDPIKFPHLSKGMKHETLNLYDEILKRREQNSVIIPWSDYRQLTLANNYMDDETIEEETKFLNAVGGVLDLRVSCNSDRYICLHPQVLANSICLYHMDDDKKQFKLEAKRFWPKESGFKKPDPFIIVRALEKTLKAGLVREVLLPLLWQETNLSDDQIQTMLKVLVGSGLLVSAEPARKHCEGLALPNFRSLSVTRQYYCPLSDKLPDSKPAVICLTEEGKYFDICCRVNADEPGREEESMLLIWAYLSPLVHTMSATLSTWPGVVVEIYLLPLGYQLFRDEKVEGDPRFPLLESLINWNKEETIAFRDGENLRVLDLDLLFPFKEKQCFESVDGFITFLLRQREKTLSSITVTQPLAPRSSHRTTLIDTSLDKLKEKSKKKREIKWNLSQEKETKTAAPVRQGYINTPADKTPPKSAEVKPSTPAPSEKPQTMCNEPMATSFVDINANEESKDKTLTAETKTGRFLNEEDEIKEANRIASGFVAAIMATAVADYIANQFNDNHTYKQVTSAAQVAAAKMTAEAVMAAQMGNIEGAAQAVMEAAKAMEKLLNTSSSNKDNIGGRSKFCTIL